MVAVLVEANILDPEVGRQHARAEVQREAAELQELDVVQKRGDAEQLRGSNGQEPDEGRHKRHAPAGVAGRSRRVRG